MKYCYHCGRSTAGDALFCPTCGYSFDKKVCPRLHVNPRTAEACSRCGSRDLSTPYPRVPFRSQLLEWLTRIAVGTFLVFVSALLIVAVLGDLAGHHIPSREHTVFAVLLAALWWGWGEVPDWFRILVRRELRKRKERDEKQHRDATFDERRR